MCIQVSRALVLVCMVMPAKKSTSGILIWGIPVILYRMSFTTEFSSLKPDTMSFQHFKLK